RRRPRAEVRRTRRERFVKPPKPGVLDREIPFGAAEVAQCLCLVAALRSDLCRHVQVVDLAEGPLRLRGRILRWALEPRDEELSCHATVARLQFDCREST